MVNGGAIVAHPDVQHSYQSALAIQERGLLRRYVTGGFYYRKGGVLEWIATALPARARQRVERQFLRRRLDALDDRLITSAPVLNFVHRVFDRALPPRVGFELFNFRSRSFERRAARLVERLQPAVVVCYDSRALTIFEAARRVDAFCVLDQSIGHVTQLVRQFEAAGVQLTVSEAEVRNSVAEVKAADVIVTSSRYVHDGLVEIGVPDERIITIPYGARLERFAPASNREPRRTVRALYVGHMSARKGVRYILEAFDRLGSVELELMMVGQDLGQVPTLHQPRERFTLLPPQPNHELPAIYSNADVFVQMSLHESSAMTIFEALASGLPVITTPNSGSVVRDGIEGFIVPPGDVDALADKLRVLTKDASLREQMGRAARARAEQFTWEHYRERYGALMEDLVRAAPADRPSIVAVHRARMKDVMETYGSGVTLESSDAATRQWSEG